MTLPIDIGRRALLAAALASPWCHAAWARPAERLIVLNPHLAEIVVALGAAPLMVATCAGTEHLSELAGLPVVQVFRQASAEPLLSVAPTRVILTPEWVKPQTLDQLRAAGVRVDLVDAEHSPAGVERRVRQVAALLGREAAAEPLLARFRTELASVTARVATVKRRPRVLFILAGGPRPILVGGRETNIAALIEMAGAVNVADGFTGFKNLSQESMIEAAPEVIFTTVEGAARGSGLPPALRAAGAQATPAGRNGRVISIPNQYLQGIGIHTPAGVRALAAQLHPGLFA